MIDHCNTFLPIVDVADDKCSYVGDVEEVDAPENQDRAKGRMGSFRPSFFATKHNTHLHTPQNSKRPASRL